MPRCGFSNREKTPCAQQLLCLLDISTFACGGLAFCFHTQSLDSRGFPGHYYRIANSCDKTPCQSCYSELCQPVGHVMFCFFNSALPLSFHVFLVHVAVDGRTLVVLYLLVAKKQPCNCRLGGGWLCRRRRSRRGCPSVKTKTGHVTYHPHNEEGPDPGGAGYCSRRQQREAHGHGQGANNFYC